MTGADINALDALPRPKQVESHHLALALRPPTRWCVRHQNGWCACKADRDPGESVSVETACNHFVTLPYGVEKRRPTCPECKERG
jgi:hypothetical protein